VNIRTETKCVECGRVFDLLDENDADEWAYGHDCEAPTSADTDAPLTLTFTRDAWLAITDAVYAAQRA
jgi:hypothetical protein